MSGFAAINGEPDGQPLLPPIALTDEATGLAAAFATMVALHSGQRPGRRRQPAGDDVPPDGPAAVAVRAARRAAAAARRRAAVHRARGARTGAPTAGGSPCRRAATASPRGCMALLGVGDDARFATFAGRAEHRDELEAVMAAWCAAPHGRRGAGRVHRRRRRGRAGDGHGRHRRRPALRAPGDDRRRRRHADAGADRPAQRRRRARCAGPGRPLDADGAEIRAHGWGDLS